MMFYATISAQLIVAIKNRGFLNYHARFLRGILVFITTPVVIQTCVVIQRGNPVWITLQVVIQIVWITMQNSRFFLKF